MVHNGRYLTARGEEGWVYGGVSQTNASQLRSQENVSWLFRTFTDPLYFEAIGPEIHERRLNPPPLPHVNPPLLQLVKVPRRHSPSCVDTRG